MQTWPCPVLVAPLVAVALLGLGCAQRAAVGPKTTAQPGRQQQRIENLVQGAAARHGVDAALVRGVIETESSFRVDARSPVGARGLMQLMPKTAAGLARRLKWPRYEIDDPAFNIEAGTAYLSYLLRRFDGSTPLALAAYHTGPARVARWVTRGRPLPSYSRRYVRDVLAAADRLKDGPPPSASPPLDRDGLRALLRAKLYGPRDSGALDLDARAWLTQSEGMSSALLGTSRGAPQDP